MTNEKGKNYPSHKLSLKNKLIVGLFGALCATTFGLNISADYKNLQEKIENNRKIKNIDIKEPFCKTLSGKGYTATASYENGKKYLCIGPILDNFVDSSYDSSSKNLDFKTVAQDLYNCVKENGEDCE